MQASDWRGVLPAITTPFDDGLAVDTQALVQHVDWLIGAGCTGIVTLGSLGEAPALATPERVDIVRTCVRAAGGRVPVVAGVSTYTTPEAVVLARELASAGANGLMVLPPYVYRGDRRETRAHLSAVLDATPLSCMLYNNPIAYGTDITPDEIGELAARHANLHAVKESSGDVRRVTGIQALVGDRLRILAGMDDAIVESVGVGAVGWVAGLVNAFPAESVRLLDLALSGQRADAAALYAWFLPLLRLDTVPKFVQHIKLVQQEVGRGHERVRPPRLVLHGAERDETLRLIRHAVATRPA
jgi:dihydrodipicolinate synthase/N-acetylneuraminate lyase